MTPFPLESRVTNLRAFWGNNFTSSCSWYFEPAWKGARQTESWLRYRALMRCSSMHPEVNFQNGFICAVNTDNEMKLWHLHWQSGKESPGISVRQSGRISWGVAAWCKELRQYSRAVTVQSKTHCCHKWTAECEVWIGFRSSQILGRPHQDIHTAWDTASGTPVSVWWELLFSSFTMVFCSVNGYLENVVEVQSSCVCVGEGAKNRLAVLLTHLSLADWKSGHGCD